jgi:hypothetical protein
MKIYLPDHPFLEWIEPNGPYLNFSFKPEILAKVVLTEIDNKEGLYKDVEERNDCMGSGK